MRSAKGSALYLRLKRRDIVERLPVREQLEITNALNDAEEALEHRIGRIPKIVYGRNVDADIILCARCNQMVLVKQRFCHYCGQKFLWANTREDEE